MSNRKHTNTKKHWICWRSQSCYNKYCESMHIYITIYNLTAMPYPWRFGPKLLFLHRTACIPWRQRRSSKRSSVTKHNGNRHHTWESWRWNWNLLENDGEPTQYVSYRSIHTHTRAHTHMYISIYIHIGRDSSKMIQHVHEFSGKKEWRAVIIQGSEWPSRKSCIFVISFSLFATYDTRLGVLQYQSRGVTYGHCNALW